MAKFIRRDIPLVDGAIYLSSNPIYHSDIPQVNDSAIPSFDYKLFSNTCNTQETAFCNCEVLLKADTSGRYSQTASFFNRRRSFHRIITLYSYISIFTNPESIIKCNLIYSFYRNCTFCKGYFIRTFLSVQITTEKSIPDNKIFCPACILSPQVARRITGR